MESENIISFSHNNFAINDNCLMRLSNYKNIIRHFQSLGFEKFYSDYLAREAGVSGMQVRKDFSNFKINGKKRGGYPVGSVLNHLESIFQKNQVHKIVIVGTGNIGRALLNFSSLEKESFKIVAAFDIDPSKFNRQGHCPVLPLDEFKDFVLQSEVKIGILAVPAIVAQETFSFMVSSGIEAVLNFAPCVLHDPAGKVLVNNIHIVYELEKLVFHLYNRSQEGVRAGDVLQRAI